MSFLTDEEAASLRLARMSLHIVGGDEEFEPQPELPVEHDDFLLDLLRSIASDSVYKFAERSNTRTTIEAIATRLTPFDEGAQALAQDFCRLHIGRVKDGAFFVFELGVADDGVNIYALVKYDYSQALEIVHREGQTGLRRIVEAFVSDRNAIQKSAIVRTRNGQAEVSISTRDRMGRPSPLLTEYFQNYLQVVRERDDQELTAEVKEVVRQTLKDHKEFLPRGGLAVSVARANDVLRAAPEINEDVIRQAVWVGAGQPDDDELKAKLDAAVDRSVRKKKLAGLAFAPSAAALPRSLRRTVTTVEGVRIEYDTSLEGQAFERQDLGDGRTRFVVTTRSYTDDVIAERTGRATRQLD